MRYPYRCNNCGKEKVINKSMNESSRKEICECGAEMVRVFVVSAIKTGDGVK